MELPGDAIPLTDAEQRELLRIVRVTVKEWLRSGYPPPGAPHIRSLRQRLGAHIRVYVDGKLVGRRGALAAARDLYAAAGEMAIEAVRDLAGGDNGLRPGDLGAVRFAVDVLHRAVRLGPERRADGTRSSGIDLARHGVKLVDGGRRALILPFEVEQRRWSAAELLSAACLRAGIASDRWRSADVDVIAFEALSFRDPD